MKRNIGLVDKIMRGAVGLLLVYIASMNYRGNPKLSVIAFFLGLYSIATSMFGVCPLYKLVGLSTKHIETQNPPQS
jgi:hypothetical protein